MAEQKDYNEGNMYGKQQKGGVVNKNKLFNAIRDGFYTIQSVHSGKVIDVPGQSKDKGKQLQQWDSNGTVAQIFYIKESCHGIFTIQNKGNGLYLDISRGSKANSAKLSQWTLNGNYGSDNQQFMFVPAGDGSYYIFNVKSGKCLDVAGASKDNGGKVHQWQPHSGNNQRWRLLN
eukprot:839162_1